MDTPPKFGFPLLKGILALHEGLEDTTPCRALAHLTISLLNKREQTYWDQLLALAKHITDDHTEEVREFGDSPQDMFQPAARCIEEYGLGILSLQRLMEVFESRGWPLNQEIISL